MGRIRKSLTFSPEVIARAEAVMRLRGFDEMSEYTAALFREEYERRNMPGAVHETPASTPPPPESPAAGTTSPAPQYPPASSPATSLEAESIANKVRRLARPGKDRKPRPAKPKP